MPAVDTAGFILGIFTTHTYIIQILYIYIYICYLSISSLVHIYQPLPIDFNLMLYQIFLDQPKRFIQRAQQGERFVPLKQRISINMYAMRFGLARRVLGMYLSSYCCDDEGFFGRWPTISKSPHFIDSKFIVVHFAFSPQYLGHGLDIFRSLPLNDNIAARVLNQSIHQAEILEF